MDRGREPIATAIIGFGMAARVFHAPLIQAAGRLTLVAASTSRADAVPDGVAVRTSDDIIHDPAIELIVIATPNSTHFDLARAALQAGKHVVVDKPFTVTSAEGHRLAELAAVADRMLAVFHNRRWDSDFLTLRKLMAAGALGSVRLLEAHWDRFRPRVSDRWREQQQPGAGLLFDLGPHMIDQVLLLLGRPDAIEADLACQREGACSDDYFSLTLHYGEARARLSAGSLCAQPRPRFSVHGTRASFVKRGLDPQEAQLKAGMDPRSPGFGEEDAQGFGDLVDDGGVSVPVPSEAGAYVRFYELVAAAIRDGLPPPVTAAEAVRVIRIIELAQTSAAEGRRLPVTWADR